MGCCVNSLNSNSVNSVSESQINLERKPMKILFLGPAGCGKTTFVRQLEKIHHIDQEDLSDNIKSTIYNTIISNMKTLLSIKTLRVHPKNKRYRNKILSLQPPCTLTSEIAHQISKLYCDDGVRKILHERDSHHLALCDNLEYFLNKISEIAIERYTPTFEDCIKIHRDTLGYSTRKFVKSVSNFGNFIFEIPDIGGAQSERRKWWHPKLLLDPDLNCIVCILAISEYNMFSADVDNIYCVNRLGESINVFRQMLELIICKYGETEYFLNKSISIVFNKYDLFTEKLKTIPITVAFDDFPSDMRPNEPVDAVRFIAGQILNVFTDFNINLMTPLQIIRTTAVDRQNVSDMFDKIAEQVVMNEMRDEIIENERQNDEMNKIKNMINETREMEELAENDSGGSFGSPLILKRMYSTPTHKHSGVEFVPNDNKLPVSILKMKQTHSLPMNSIREFRLNPKKDNIELMSHSIVFEDL